MKTNYSKGQIIKFKNPHGIKLDGTVYDSNEYAIVVINSIHGQYVIDHKDVIQEIKESIESKYIEEEWSYYAAYSGNTVIGNPGHYSPSKNYGGGYNYLSPDVDDDGC